MFTKPILLIAIGLTISAGSFAQSNSKMKSINNNAPVKCSKTITINASSEKVWKVMTNIDNWARWQTDITKAKLNGELKPETTFDWKTGGVKIHSTLHTVEPFKNFGWTGKTFGMCAIHNWTLTENNGQTKVSVDESMEGFFAKLLKKLFNKNLEKGMQNWLDLLKQECEK
ncbi:SRPBCC family protein [Cyclobacterium sp.]|uniref:SRPBCC family protein n=1 Tax=Cyclobacterium sp. TaxID=1966343 RepID=UPI0025B85906|nr:SRPBCC family protein [Cyclobacterium sp.]